MALIVTPRKLTQRAHFYEQLGQLTAVGIPIMGALDVLAKNPPARELRQPLREMISELARGSTLTDALQSQNQWIPSFDVALIHAAEQSGRLDAVFRMLATYYNDRAALIRQLMSDLAYPVFVFHFMIFVFPFVYWFGGKLSGVGFFVETIGLLAVLYGIVFFAIYSSQGKRGHAWRSMLETFCRLVPMLGTARKALALSRLSAALEALINAGTNIIEAWDLAATACGSPAIQRVVQTWRPQLADGRTPAELVRESTVFPEVFSNLYNSGEVSGQLDDTLKRLHKYYEEEAQRKFRFFAKWSAQGFYFIVAGTVAFKVISYYMGYFSQLNEIMK